MKKRKEKKKQSRKTLNKKALTVMLTGIPAPPAAGYIAFRAVRASRSQGTLSKQDQPHHSLATGQGEGSSSFFFSGSLSVL